jgi:hypothetical protein
MPPASDVRLSFCSKCLYAVYLLYCYLYACLKRLALLSVFRGKVLGYINILEVVIMSVSAKFLNV